MEIQDTNQLHEIADCLYHRDAIDNAITQVAEHINERFVQRPLLVLCLLNGGVVFTGQLLPKLTMPLELTYIHVTRYGEDNKGQAQLRWLATSSENVRGRDLLVCDDIFDEGKTLRELTRYLLSQGANAVYTAVLADKQHTRKPEDFKPDFVGLLLPDRYVFGMGMDYSGYWRNAPGIYAVKDDQK